MPNKSRLGQNFLRDPQAVQRIASALGDLTSRTVVEIGPGKGAITETLVARAKYLIAVEFDRELAWHLQERFSPDKGICNASVMRQDILEFDFAQAAETAQSPLLIVGNLPYYITSPILLKLTEAHRFIDSAVLMVQREVADRITALPGTREFGLLSASLQLYGSTEALFTLPPSAFVPPPEVHSTVFRWNFKPRFQELGVEEARFLKFLKLAFAQKRKTLFNNLRAAQYPTVHIAKGFESTGISPQGRAESLSLEQFAALWRSLRPSATP